MAVKIGHASMDERNRISGGSAGDQTGKEVFIREWYDKGWNIVLRPKSSSLAEKSAKACEKGCANKNIGYDQYQRNGLNTQAKKVNYDLSKITTKCECDCSSFMTVCAIAGGANIAYGSNGPTTSTMRKVFVGSGNYSVLTGNTYLKSDKYLKRGDILVKEGSHTVMVLENGSATTTTVTTSASSTSLKLKVSENVKSIQKWLNTYYKTGLVVDGDYGPKTKKALIKAWQKEVGGLEVDGDFGPKSKAAASKNNLKKGSKGILVTILQATLTCQGYSCNGIDGDFGNGCYKAVIAFQKKKKLTQDGIVGKGTWSELFK